MNPAPKQFLCVASITLLLTGSLWAQLIIRQGGFVTGRTGRTPASMPEDAGINEGGVVVMDNFAAQDAIAQADLLIGAKDWAGAAVAYQKVIDQYGPYLLTVSKNQRRIVADVLQEKILNWPREGLAAYVRYADPRAAQALLEAKKNGSLADLLLIGQRYFATPAAAAALELAADRLADGGDPGAGAALLERLQSHPEAQKPALLARLAMWKSWSATPLAAQAAMQRLQAAALPQDPLLRRTAEALRQPLPDRTTPRDCPLFGGDETRTQSTATSSQADVVIWNRVYRVLPKTVRNEEEDGWRQASKQGILLNSLPVVADGLIYLQDQTALAAYNLNSGSLVWKHKISTIDWEDDAGNGNRGAFNLLASQQLFIPTVAQGRVYSCLGRENMTPVWVNRGTTRSGQILCCDARNGAELWTFPPVKSETPIPEVIRGMSFDTSPLVLYGRLYAVARRNQGSGNEDVHLVCLEADTGRFLWSVFLSSAPLMRFGAFSQSYLAADAGRILAVPHTGSIVAVDAVTGRIAWLNLYPRQQSDPDAGNYAFNRRLCGWLTNPPFVEQGRMLAMPDDGSELYLLDTASGRELVRMKAGLLGQVQELVGVLDSRLYGLSVLEGQLCVFACHLDTQKIEWKAPLTGDLFGRASLTRRGIFVPTAKQLWFYPLTGESPTALPPPRLPEQMGNVVALPDQVLVTGWSVITSYARWEDVRQRLEEAVRANPAKPGPRLDMAEVALRSGGANLAFGLEMMDQAVELAGGWTKMQPVDFQRRVFRSCLSLAADAIVSKRLPTAEKLYERAYRCAPDAPSRIEMLLAFADFLDSVNRTPEALAKLQEILADPALRREMIPRLAEKEPEDQSSGESQAGRIARLKIEKTVRQHGPGVYARFEAQARQKFEAALQLPENQRVDKLNELVTVYPEASVVPQALLAKARAYIQAGAHEQAYYALLSWWNGHREEAELALVLRLLAEEANAWGRPTLAATWLARGQSMFRNYPLKLDNGTTTTFAEMAGKYHPGGSLPGDSSLPDLPASLPFKYAVRASSPALLEPAYTPPGARNDLLVICARAPRPASAESPGLPEGPTLFVLKAADGQLLFPPLALPLPATRLIAVLPDRLLLQTQMHILAVSTATGKILWRFGDVGELPDTDPENINLIQTTILAGRQLIGIRGTRATGKGEIFSLQAADGSLAWRYPLQDLPEDQVAFSGDRYLAYRINTPRGVGVVVVNVDRGEEIHKLMMAKLGQSVSCGFSPEGRLIVVTEQKMAAYDPDTGETLWGPLDVSAVGLLGAATAVTFGPDGFYVEEESGARLVKRDYQNGQKIWSAALAPAQDARRTQDAAALSPRVYVEGDTVFLTGLKQADALKETRMDNSATIKIWNGRVPGSADFILSRNTIHFIVALNEKSPLKHEARPRPETEKAYSLLFYNKQAQMRCDAILDLGAYAQFGSFFVRDGAAGLVSPGRITVFTATQPAAEEVKLGE